MREVFWATISNKQLNFLQHVRSLLEINGRAAIVVPDNVLFEGGAGETVRRRLLDQCDVHTFLRLPTGIFYAGGEKASLDIFWLRGNTLEDTHNLPAPHTIAAEIVEDLEAALAQFSKIALTLGNFQAE